MESLGHAEEVTGRSDSVEISDGVASKRRRRVSIVATTTILGGVVILALVIPHFLVSPTHLALEDSLQPPAFEREHLLGTDALGQDLLSRLAAGLKTSLVVGLSSVFLGGIVGTAFGTLSGYMAGRVDELIMRVADVQLAIPAVLLAMTLVSILRPSTTTVILVLSLYVWVMFARVSRAQVLALRRMDMIVATRSVGASTFRIISRHVLPNIASPLIALATIQLANLIVIEAALGYLGIGVPPPTPTLGAMIAEGQGYLTTGEWWVTVVPGCALALVVICINILGDSLRDRLDPFVSMRS